MPKQWILIALYMVLAFLAFAASIEIARYQVIQEEKEAAASKMAGQDGGQKP